MLVLGGGSPWIEAPPQHPLPLANVPGSPQRTLEGQVPVSGWGQKDGSHDILQCSIIYHDIAFFLVPAWLLSSGVVLGIWACSSEANPEFLFRLSGFEVVKLKALVLQVSG